jgi:transposase
LRIAPTPPTQSAGTSADAAIRAVIPQPSDQIGHRLRRDRAGGRPPGFDAETYTERNTVERCVARLKQWRDLAMQTDKLAISYQAALHLAAILIWTRRPDGVPFGGESCAHP